MKTRLIALTYTFTAAACGSHPPAQDPSSESTTSTQLVAVPSDRPVATSATDSAPAGVTADVPAPQAATPTSDSDHSGEAKEADNTERNKRDRRDSLTPGDQGNSASEVKITASIRKAIMDDSTLSASAKNVKIVTVGTKVTLRGPVKSDKERATIEGIAKRTSGVTEVDNQLEVSQ